MKLELMGAETYERGVQGSPKRCGLLEGACNVWRVSGSASSLGRWRLKTKLAYPREEVDKSDKLAQIWQQFHSMINLAIAWAKPSYL